MAISAVGTLQSTANNAITTQAVSPTTAGNVLMMATALFGGTTTVSGVSGGGVITWNRVAGPFDGPAAGGMFEIWAGKVSTTGAATITLTWSAAVTGNFIEIDVQEFTAGLGAGTVWSVDGAAGTQNNAASSTVVTYPSLTPTSTALYFGHSAGDGASGAGSSGTGTGFTFVADSATDQIVYHPTLSTTGSPAGTLSAAAHTSAIAVLMTAVADSVSHVATATPAPVGTTTSASTTAVTPTLPTGTASGDRVFVVQAGNNTSGATPTSWTALYKDVQVGPTGTAPGAGTGRRYLSCYYRDYDGAWSMPAFSLTSATQNTNAVSATTLRKTSATDVWDTPVASTAGNTAAATTAYSVTTGSVTVTTRAMVIIGMATNDNVTASAETLSGGTAAFANLIERSDTGSATGNDVSIKTYTAEVATGATAAWTHAVTLSGASEGGSVVAMQSASAVPVPPVRKVQKSQSVFRASNW